MLAKSDPWKDFVNIPDFHGAATSREISPGVWELLVEGQAEVGGFAAFALMAALGFIVLL
jgi:hypothetical protein